jgi:hypothetical protein
MLAVTIGVGAGYVEMARLAAARVEALCGLPTRILGEVEMRAVLPARLLERYGPSASMFLKLHVFDLVSDDDILYFDADLVFLRPWSPRDLAGSAAFIAVRDLWYLDFIRHEAALADVEPDAYFNTGLFIASRHHHAEALRETAARVDQVHDLGLGLTEQTLTNRVLYGLGVPVRFLDRRCNFVGYWTRGTAARMLASFAAHAPRASLRAGSSKDGTLAALASPLGGDPARGPHLPVDEEVSRRLAGRIYRFRREGEAGCAVELRDDHTIGLSWSEDAAYWYPLRGPMGTSLYLFSRDHATATLVPGPGGLWRGRVSLLDALPGEGRGSEPPPDTAPWPGKPLGRRLLGQARRSAKALARPLAPSIGSAVTLGPHRAEVLAGLVGSAGPLVRLAGLDSETEALLRRRAPAVRFCPDGEVDAVIFGHGADSAPLASVRRGGLIAGTYRRAGELLAAATGRPLLEAEDGVWWMRSE